MINLWKNASNIVQFSIKKSNCDVIEHWKNGKHSFSIKVKIYIQLESSVCRLHLHEPLVVLSSVHINRMTIEQKLHISHGLKIDCTSEKSAGLPLVPKFLSCLVSRDF